MDAKQFLAEFGHIVNAPGGLRNLRQLVMNLALSGRLMDSTKPLPENIDQQIEKVRSQYLRRQGRLKKPVLFGPALIQHFDLPSNWKWKRVGELCDLQTGATPSTQNPRYFGGDIRWLVSGDINQGEIYECEGRITQEGLNNSNCKVLPVNSVLIALNGQGKTRASVAILRIPAACNQSLVAMIPFSGERLLPEFLYLALKYRYFEIREITGQKQRRGLNMGIVSELSIPLPRLEEQKRIVAKVDELMALCDKLEALQQKRRKLQTLIRTTALDALANAQSARELKAAWLRVQEHLPLLLDDQTSIPALQNLSSKLAVRGLLSNFHLREKVPLDTIAAVTAKLRKEYIKKKWLRKQKIVGKAQLESDLYPSHWKVVAFDEIAVVMGGITKGRNLKDRQTASYPYLRVANVQRGYFDLAEIKKIEIPIEESDKYQLMESDLLITEGGDWDKVGRTAIWPGKITNCLHQNHIFKARVPSAFILKEWVELVFNSEIGRDYFAGASKQTTNLASINMTQLRSFPFPIPPLSEQKEILNRLILTLETSRTLQKQITKKQNLAERFSETAVATLTGTQLKDKEIIKAPKTKLMTQLKLKTSPGKKDQAPLAAILAKHNGELSAKGLWNYSGLTIDGFYQQLKTEMACGWIDEPEKARMVEKATSIDSAEVA